MNNQREKSETDAEAVIARIGERARNLYETRQLLCTEAVVSALNHGLKGGLTDAQATALAAPFSVALGESGCLCGALSGAVLASGLLLGRDRPYLHRKEMRDTSRQLHDAFKAANGTTCCRVLSKKVRNDKKAHFQQCADFTAQAAEMAARMVLEKRPELIGQVNDEFLVKRQSALGGVFLRLVHLFHAD